MVFFPSYLNQRNDSNHYLQLRLLMLPISERPSDKRVTKLLSTGINGITIQLTPLYMLTFLRKGGLVELVIQGQSFI
jgi:hypothetical protein